MAIEPSWKNVSSYTVFIAGAHEWLSSADYVFFFLFFSPFSRTTEGCAQAFTLVSKTLALSTVPLCLGCRVPPPNSSCLGENISAICWQRGSRCGSIAHEAESKSDTCQPWTSPQKRRRRVETTYIWWGLPWTKYHASVFGFCVTSPPPPNPFKIAC